MLVRSTRPRFILNAVMAAAVGSAAGWRDAAHPSGAALLAVLVTAGLIHAATNSADDYFDFVRRWDRGAVPDEFSGGSGVLPDHEAAPRDVFGMALALYGLAVVLGGWLVLTRGWPVAALGSAALALSWAYAAGRRPLVSLGVGELALTCSWLLAALTGYFVQTGVLSFVPVVVALSVAWPTNLLANEIPDYPEDRPAGKANLVVRLGPVAATRLFAVLMVLQPLSLVAAVVGGAAPVWALAGLLSLPWALAAVRVVVGAPLDYAAQYPARVGTAATRQLVAAALVTTLVAAAARTVAVSTLGIAVFLLVWARLAARVSAAASSSATAGVGQAVL